MKFMMNLLIKRPKNNQADVHNAGYHSVKWEDRTPFEAIATQFGLAEQQVIKVMRTNISAGAFKRWRARVTGRKTKHAELRAPGVSRHQSSTHNKANR